jgi:hypothetical protein
LLVSRSDLLMIRASACRFRFSVQGRQA